MGDFEVTVSFTIKAQDRFDAARKVYAMIRDKPPTSFWVCNEGGVGDEVRVDGGHCSKAGIAPEASVHELVDDIYRLGVVFGAGQVQQDAVKHEERVAELKSRLITAAATRVGQ